jgi:hypothetical protein
MWLLRGRLAVGRFALASHEWATHLIAHQYGETMKCVTQPRKSLFTVRWR